MNNKQKTILHTLATNDSGILCAPSYSLSIDEANAYCGLANMKAIKLNRDYSCAITNEGRRIAQNLT